MMCNGPGDGKVVMVSDVQTHVSIVLNIISSLGWRRPCNTNQMLRTPKMNCSLLTGRTMTFKWLEEESRSLHYPTAKYLPSKMKVQDIEGTDNVVLWKSFA